MGISKDFLETLSKLASLEQRTADVSKFVERVDSKIDNLVQRLTKIENTLSNMTENLAKLKKSVEFKELVSVYFFKTSQFENALKELEKIQFNKREFSVHKKLLYCYIYLDKLDEAIKYIKKIRLILN